MPRAFVHALLQHSKEVRALETTSADEFQGLLTDLREVLSGRLAALKGQSDPINEFRLQSILSETEDGIRLLRTKAGHFFDLASRKATEMSVEHLTREVGALSKAFSPVQQTVAIDVSAVEKDPAQRLIAGQFGSAVNRYGEQLLSDVRQRLFVGLRSGDETREILSDLAASEGPLGASAMSKAEEIARTGVRQAYGGAQHGGLVEAAKKDRGLKKIWLHLSVYVCTTCIKLHGTIRPLNGTWTIVAAKGPPRRLKQIPHAPAHNNCSCRSAPMKDSWRKGLLDLGYLAQTAEDVETSRKPVL